MKPPNDDLAVDKRALWAPITVEGEYRVKKDSVPVTR